jgi:hypothetical protein
LGKIAAVLGVMVVAFVMVQVVRRKFAKPAADGEGQEADDTRPETGK